MTRRVVRVQKLGLQWAHTAQSDDRAGALGGLRPNPMMGRIQRVSPSDLRTSAPIRRRAIWTSLDFLVLAVDDNAGARSIKAGVYNGDA